MRPVRTFEAVFNGTGAAEIHVHVGRADSHRVIFD